MVTATLGACLTPPILCYFATMDCFCRGPIAVGVGNGHPLAPRMRYQEAAFPLSGRAHSERAVSTRPCSTGPARREKNDVLSQKCLANGGDNRYVARRPNSHVPVAVCRSVGIRTRGRTAA